MISKKYAIVLIIFIFGCRAETLSDLKNSAEDAIKDKQYARALEYLDKALSLQPDDQEVHYFRGQALRSQLFDDGAHIDRADLSLAEKASAAFEQVIKINPKYDGRKFVVDPYTKIQGIWGSVATTYTVKSKRDSAKWAFKRGQDAGAFYPAIVEYNKNIMASCAENAIIFTNGDNDTYPMWYLQLMENYRTDITVVNLSLLNVEWYINQLRNNYPYGPNNLGCIKGVDLENMKAQKWSSTQIQLPKHPQVDERVTWTVYPTVDERLIRTQDLMVVEILKRNNWKRPVYFSTTVYSGNKIGLDNYLAFEGLVFCIVPQKKEISPENLEYNLLENYTYAGINDPHLQYIDELKPLYQNYTSAFRQLSDYFTDNAREKDAQKVLDFMKKNLSEDITEI